MTLHTTRVRLPFHAWRMPQNVAEIQKYFSRGLQGRNPPTTDPTPHLPIMNPNGVSRGEASSCSLGMARKSAARPPGGAAAPSAASLAGVSFWSLSRCCDKGRGGEGRRSSQGRDPAGGNRRQHQWAAGSLAAAAVGSSSTQLSSSRQSTNKCLIKCCLEQQLGGYAGQATSRAATVRLHARMRAPWCSA